MQLRMLPEKWRQFCLGLSVLNDLTMVLSCQVSLVVPASPAALVSLATLVVLAPREDQVHLVNPETPDSQEGPAKLVPLEHQANLVDLAHLETLEHLDSLEELEHQVTALWMRKHKCIFELDIISQSWENAGIVEILPCIWQEAIYPIYSIPNVLMSSRLKETRHQLGLT